MSDSLETPIVPAARKGVWAWVLLIGSLIVPVIAPIVLFIAQVFGYHYYNKQQDAGAVNSRNAANWTFTYMIVSLGCGVIFYGADIAATVVPAVATTLLVLGLLALGLWIIVSIVTLVFAIMGIVAASRGDSFDTAFAIRVVKGARSYEQPLLED